MNFSEAMQMLGTKLQGKYGHLGFKYKKSDKTLTRHSKNFTYMIAFSSFGGNTKDSISIEVCYIINTRPYDPYGYAKHRDPLKTVSAGLQFQKFTPTQQGFQLRLMFVPPVPPTFWCFPPLDQVQEFFCQ